MWRCVFRRCCGLAEEEIGRYLASVLMVDLGFFGRMWGYLRVSFLKIALFDEIAIIDLLRMII